MREDAPPVEHSLRDSTTTFGPTRGAVIGTLAAAVVFVIVLEFLVLISFIGQHLWTDPRLGGDVLFTLPLLLWVLVAAVSLTAVMRIVTCWFRFTEDGVRVNGLFRRQRLIRWEEVDRVLAVHEIHRGSSAIGALDTGGAFDAIVLLGPDGQRLASVPSRFYSLEAQQAVLIAASEAGTEVVEIHGIGPKELRAIAPRALAPIDGHPRLMLLAAAVFYLAHNVLTFAVWGL